MALQVCILGFLGFIRQHEGQRQYIVQAWEGGGGEGGGDGVCSMLYLCLCVNVFG